MENFGDYENAAKLEDTKQCPKCGNWMQLRDTGYGNAWAHVKADGRLEKLSSECFPEDKPAPPKMGDTVIVIDWEGHEAPAIVTWAGSGSEHFSAYVLPVTVYGHPAMANVELARHDRPGERVDVPTSKAERFGWRRP